MKTVQETAEHFKVSKTAVYNWLQEGLKHEIRSEIGRKDYIVIDPAEVYLFKGIKEE